MSDSHQRHRIHRLAMSWPLQSAELYQILEQQTARPRAQSMNRCAALIERA
jgi:hypothetical protein